MPNPRSQSTEATSEDRAAAEHIRSVIREAAGVVRFVRDRLLLEARSQTPKPVALIDGECAVVGPDALSATQWIIERTFGLCDPAGFLGEALTALEQEASREALEALAEYVREHRAEGKGLASRQRSVAVDYLTDR